MVRNIAIFALHNVQLLDIAGPADVFSEANRQSNMEVYKTYIISTTPDPIITSCGIQIIPDYTIYDDLPSIDTLLIAGSPSMPNISINQDLVSWLQQMYTTTRRMGSVCTGTFLLAAAKLLDGIKVTTHWAFATQLQSMYPLVIVKDEVFSFQHHKIYSSAGVTSGIDLTFILVEQDLGKALAQKVAAHLVTLFKRQGSQKQFSQNNELSLHGRTVLNDLQLWVQSNLSKSLNVKVLAAHLGITSRHLSRIFKDEMNITPAKWLEEIRLEHAKKLFREQQLLSKQVAAACGFSNENVLRQLFMRHLNMTPTEYRKLYQYKINASKPTN